MNNLKIDEYFFEKTLTRVNKDANISNVSRDDIKSCIKIF